MKKKILIFAAAILAGFICDVFVSNSDVLALTVICDTAKIAAPAECASLLVDSSDSGAQTARGICDSWIKAEKNGTTGPTQDNCANAIRSIVICTKQHGCDTQHYALSVAASYKEIKEGKRSKTPPQSSSSKKSDSDSKSNGSGSGSSSDKSGTLAPSSDTGSCTSLLGDDYCNGSGISKLLNLIITIMTGAVVTAGTVGIIICAFLWLTARDNEQQLAMAKRRMRDVIIGIIAWVMIAALANLFIPKTSSEVNNIKSGNTEVKIK